jgi:hypothetical protein
VGFDVQHRRDEIRRRRRGDAPARPAAPVPAQNGGVGDTADSVAASLGGIVEAQQKALAERDETIAELAGDVRRLSRRMADPAAERDRPRRTPGACGSG